MSNFRFLIDWNNDGDYSDSHEDVTDYVMDASWSLGFSEPYQHVAGETRLNLRLRNHDKRFSPEASSSPMAGNILPQRRIKIQNVASGTVDLYTGYIESILPTGGTYNEQECAIVGVGLKQFLERQEYYSPFWENVTVDEVINDIVINTSLPLTSDQYLVIDVPGQNLIDTHWIGTSMSFLNAETSPDILEYVGDTWEHGISAIQAINDLVNADRGHFFNDRSGSAVYWNRAHLLINDTLQGTVNNTWAEMDYRYATEDIRNIVRVKNYPRAIDEGDVLLWSLDKPRTVPAGETVSFRAQFQGQDRDSRTAGRNVVTPNVEDGSLAIAPSNANYSIETVEVNARSLKVDISNTGDNEFTVTRFFVYGQLITTYNTEEYEAFDTVSIARYGRHVMTIDNKLLNKGSFAQAMADYELSNRKDPRGIVRSITIKSRNDDLDDFMINRTIGDWIQVVDDQTDHDEEYVIMGESHRWRVGDFHSVDYVLQPADGQDYIIIDVSGKNDIDGGRYIIGL